MLPKIDPSVPVPLSILSLVVENPQDEKARIELALTLVRWYSGQHVPAGLEREAFLAWIHGLGECPAY